MFSSTRMVAALTTTTSPNGYSIYCSINLASQRETQHTATTLWLASGENLEWIARQLGHTSTELLFRVYSRYVPNLTRRNGFAFETLIKDHLSKTT